MSTNQAPLKRTQHLRVLVALTGLLLVVAAVGVPALAPVPAASAADNSRNVSSVTNSTGDDGDLGGVVVGGGVPKPRPSATPDGPTPTPNPDGGDTGGSPTSTPVPGSSPGATAICTHSGSYWVTHPLEWPVTSLNVGGVMYTQAQLLSILNTPPRGDATYTLIQQLIPALLNATKLGQYNDPIFLSTITTADQWLVAHPLGSKPKNPDATVASNYADTLSSYNAGATGPLSCEYTGPSIQIELCHSMDSNTNPYEKAIVSISSVENAIHVHGHGDDNGPLYPGPDWGDIIPPFDFENIHFPGLNWSVEGQTIWANGCVPPQPTPTPTPVPNDNNPPNQYEQTCLTGQATDSTTGQMCDKYHGVVSEYHSGTWFTVRTYCMTNAQCETGVTPTPPPPGDYPNGPCVPKVLPSGFVLDCVPSEDIQTWNLHAEADTSCPINEVTRAPYPRSLVNVETQFTLAPPNTSNGTTSAPQSPANLDWYLDSHGNPTEEGYRAGIWKNLSMTMRSRRFNGGELWFGQIVPGPTWTFADRDWNTGVLPRVQQGASATYIYQTSSADLDTVFGRSFDMVNKQPGDTYNLPAYGVTLQSACGHEWKSNFEIAARQWTKTGPCYPTRLLPDGKTYEPAGTSNQGCNPGWVAPGYGVYSWREQATSWAGIDLRFAGRTTPYDIRMRTQSGGTFDGQTYWDEPGGIWVPVLEVQSVLRDECVANGSCVPPTAEPSY